MPLQPGKRPVPGGVNDSPGHHWPCGQKREGLRRLKRSTQGDRRHAGAGSLEEGGTSRVRGQGREQLRLDTAPALKSLGKEGRRSTGSRQSLCAGLMSGLGPPNRPLVICEGCLKEACRVTHLEGHGSISRKLAIRGTGQPGHQTAWHVVVLLSPAPSLNSYPAGTQ